jgi:predicted alpha/beta-hydrolase family hydrolase
VQWKSSHSTTLIWQEVRKGRHSKRDNLIDFHTEQAVKAQEKHPGHPVVLVGKSMGSRVGCMVAGQEDASVAAVVCLGYPLKGMNGQLRDETLLNLKAPVLFVQGTKDSMCPLDKLEQVRKKLSIEDELYTVEGGDHGFKVGAAALKKSFLTHAEMEKKAVDTIQTFLTKVLSR